MLIHGVTSLTLPLFSDDAKCLRKNMHCAYSVLGDVCACACTEQADANLRHTFVRFDKAQESLQFVHAFAQMDYSSVFRRGLRTHLSRVWVFRASGSERHICFVDITAVQKVPATLLISILAVCVPRPVQFCARGA